MKEGSSFQAGIHVSIGVARTIDSVLMKEGSSFQAGIHVSIGVARTYHRQSVLTKEISSLQGVLFNDKGLHCIQMDSSNWCD